MQKILVWEAWNKKRKQFEHNHIEDGWENHTMIPTIKHPIQEGWKNGKWRVTKAFLIDGKVVEEEA